MKGILKILMNKFSKIIRIFNIFFYFPLTILMIFTAILSFLSILFLDQSVVLIISNRIPSEIVSFFDFITDFGLGGYWFALFGGGTVVHILLSRLASSQEMRIIWKRKIRCWFFGLVAMSIAGIGIQCLKILFGRPRPKAFLYGGETAFSPFSGQNSFPSGHSQVIWTAAVVLWFLYPPLRPFYILTAVSVSLSRIMVSAHYLSDVMMGSVVGIVFAILTARAFQFCNPAPLDLRQQR